MERRYLPIVVIVETNSSCFNLNKMEVFPALSKPNATTLISIFGPMCTLLSLVNATGILGPSLQSSAKSANCRCCS